MVKIKDVLSEIKNSTSSNNLDDRQPNKFLYDKYIDVCKFLMKRESDNRRLYRSTESFMTIDCLELKLLTSDCQGINCQNLYVSKTKIPATFQSSNGSLLQVFSVDGTTQITQTTPYSLSKIQHREFNNNTHYYYVSGEKIYSTLPYVKLFGMFINSSEVENLLSGNSCSGLLDSSSGVPDWISTIAVDTIVQSIAGITKRLPDDENSNLSSNIKQ